MRNAHGGFLATIWSIVLGLAGLVALSHQAHAANGSTSPLRRPSGHAVTEADSSNSAPNDRQKAGTNVESRPFAAAPRLQEVIVTATRRTELAQDVPIALAVLTGARLQQSGVKSMSGVAALVPGLQLGRVSPGFSLEVLRGISTSLNATGATVATYFDDTPTTLASVASAGYALTPDPDLYDLRRIEVLKGPQGTLFGASSMGGVIRYIFNQPDLRKVSGSAELGYEGIPGHGTGNSQHLVLNLPLVKNVLGIRLEGFRIENPAFIDNVFRHQNDVNTSRSEGGRLAILWRPSEAFSAQLWTYYQRLSSANQPVMDVQPLTLQPIYGDLKTAEKLPESMYVKLFVNNLRIRYRFPWATLESSTSLEKSYTRFVDDASNDFGIRYGSLIGGNAASVQLVADTKKTTEELRLTSPAKQRIAWLLGYYYTDENAKQPQSLSQYSAVNATDTLVFPNLFTVGLASALRENAFYGDITYHPVRAFDIQAGLRYDRIEQEFSQPYVIFAGRPLLPAIYGSATLSKLTYLGTLRYHVSRDQMLYARIATGYRPGGPNDVIPASTAPKTYQPDHLTSYELGLKGSLPKSSLQYSMDLYRINWDNIQIQGVDPATGFGFFDNGGRAYSEGVEFALHYRPIAALRFGLSGSYDTAKLTESILVPGIMAKQGDTLPYAPKEAVTGTVDYRRALTARVIGYLGVTVSQVGARRAYFKGQIVGLPQLGPAYGSAVGRLPAYTLLNLRAGVGWRAVTIMIYVHNVTNELGAVAAYANFTGADLAHGTVGPLPLTVTRPRTFGVTIRYNF